MYHQTRLYDMSFVSRTKRPPTKPQIVFTLEKRHLSKCIARLERLVQLTNVEAYCGKEVDFRFPTPDLFGNVEFGYGGCGFMTESGEEISFCIELSEMHLHHATLTINLLTHALLAPAPDKPKSSNRTQQVDLETCCMHGEHGHSVGGYISGQMREWLRKQWHQGDSDNWIQWVSMPDKVIAAMRQTWRSIVPKDQRRWASECSGSITEDGRFILNCMGNACDIAIYPDSIGMDEHSSVRFSCHNLDGARQQLTLLAGLAKLCELARADTA